MENNDPIDVPWESQESSTDQGDQTPSDKGTLVSKIQSGLSGFEQGLTQGFSDEIEGLGTAAIADPFARLFTKLTGPESQPTSMPEPKSFSDTYVEARDRAREANKQAQLANPLTYAAGNVAGSATTAIVAPEGLATQAGLGALQSIGESETPVTPENAGALAREAAIGGLGSVALPIAGKAAAGTVKHVVGWSTEKIAQKMTQKILEGDKATQEAIRDLAKTQVGKDLENAMAGSEIMKARKAQIAAKRSLEAAQKLEQMNKAKKAAMSVPNALMRNVSAGYASTLGPGNQQEEPAPIDVPWEQGD